MIQLDSDIAAYQPGDTISGSVVFNIEHQQTIKALSLQIAGCAATRWETIVANKKKNKKQKNGQQQPDTKLQVYTNREDYMASTMYFLGSDEATPKPVNVGQYIYTFHTSLPERAVSSYEHPRYGHIRYELRAVIDFAKSSHIQNVRPVIVRRPYDLRLEGARIQHYACEIVEKKSKLKFWQRPVMLHVHLPQNGYIPGEAIDVQAKILNYDQVKWDSITYRLNLYSSFCGRYKKKTKMQLDRRNIVQLEHRLHGQKTSVVQHFQSIRVPAELTPTTELKLCKCIQITYELEVVVRCTAGKRQLIAQMPLKIGTISLHDRATGEVGGGANKLQESMAWASAPNLLVAERSNGIGGLHAFEPSAPSDETVEYPTSREGAVISLHEADFMKAVKLNDKRKGLGSVEQLDYKPRYVFYKMENT